MCYFIYKECYSAIYDNYGFNSNGKPSGIEFKYIIESLNDFIPSLVVIKSS